MTAFGLLILRLTLGLILAAHGAQKVFGWWGGTGIAGWTQMIEKLRIRPAQPWAWIAALSELVGGLLLAAGLLSPVGSFAIAGSMLVAIATVHLSRGFWNSKGGYEFNLVILGAAAALALIGPGAFSLDRLFSISLPEPGTLILLTIATIAGVGATLASRRVEATKPQLA